DAERLSGLRKTHRHAVRIGDAVAPAEGGAEHARRVEPGNETHRFDRIQPLDVDAKAPLQRDVSPKRVDARLRGEKKEIAVLMEIDRVTDLVGEALEQTDRLE